MNSSNRVCQDCGEKLTGREGQKFCSEYCRSAFHYKAKKGNEPSFYKKVDKQLKFNRRILRDFNKSGKSFVRKKAMHDAGFNPNYFTHYWKNQNDQVYLFCYEYGFLSVTENNQEKYVLVTKQPYMPDKGL
ncbi:MAG: hypothetical protein JXR10_16240 [Cyclobacteriaceae bacterium]